MMVDEVDDGDLPVLNCWGCTNGNPRSWCPKCHGSFKLFWVDGYSFPYTPEGEQRAKRVAKARDERAIAPT
jgi:hypothetical protein